MTEEEDIKTGGPTAKYESGDIKTLSSRDHVRERLGMYIGRAGNGDHSDDGIYVLIKEVIDNSVDEFAMKAGNKVEITLVDGVVSIRDYGRGIPLDKLKDCVSDINTGGKFKKNGEDGPFSCSVGMNGVGLKAVNFLSETFEATAWRDGKFCTVVYQEGQFVSQKKGKGGEANGTFIKFKPSQAIFPDYHFELKYIRRRLQHYSWLNPGLRLVLNGENFYSRRGLLDLMESKLESNALYDIIHYRSDMLEFAFCHINSSNETYYSFVNTQFTSDGGTHLAAFKEGICKAINELAPKGKTIDSDDIRTGLMGCISIKHPEPIFESQTKNKLGNTDVRASIVPEVKQAIVTFLYKNPGIRDTIFEKISHNETIRRQIMTIRKGAKEMAAKASLKIENLSDCKYHFNDIAKYKKPADQQKCNDTMIFLTEGKSAAGSVIHSRNPEFQAVFALRGKVLNCYGKSEAELYKNEELYGIMQAIGAQKSLDNLRYAKIVIATDADYDGFHIRILLINYFLTYFPQLVLSEHLYILETPLFRVRSKSKKPIYCYSDEERDKAIKKIGAGAEVTRFKGLGEISPDEFKQFIDSDIRLQPVIVDKPRNVDSTLKFFMGGNDDRRREFILNHLV